jgi:hypothetical protein
LPINQLDPQLSVLVGHDSPNRGELRPGRCSVGGDQELGGGQLGVQRVGAEQLGVGADRAHCAKTAAGEWALGRDPTLQAVRVALRRRRGGSTEPIDPAQVARLLAAVRARLAEVRDAT